VNGVAPAQVIIAKVTTNGCVRRPDLDTKGAYAFTYSDLTCTPPKTRLFYLPHELSGSGYTLRQLAQIEQALAYYGFDLFPLDWNLH
jgi:hypothetical protein